MGTCPSRQAAPPRPAVVVNVRNLPPPPPEATSATTPPPPRPPAPDGPADAVQLTPNTQALARRQALALFFQNAVVTTPRGKKLHIMNYCQHGNKEPGDTVWTWCAACTRKYQKADASNPDMPYYPGEA